MGFPFFFFDSSNMYTENYFGYTGEIHTATVLQFEMGMFYTTADYRKRQ